MKLKYHLTNWMFFISLLLLIQRQSSVLSLKITRGEHDTVWYGKDYREMVNRTDLRTMSCNDNREGCKCNSKNGYNTVIYNTSTMANFAVRCVKDEDKALGIIEHEGEYITSGNRKCLGVGNKGRIKKVQCNRNEISLRWLRIFLYFVNLKTLKCLEWNDSSKKFTAEYCKSAKATQQWTMMPNGSVKLNNPVNFKPKPLHSNHAAPHKNYKGCARVSGDKMIAVVKRSPDCETNCSIKVSLNIPLLQEGLTCKFRWEESTYSMFGQKWSLFPLTNREWFHLGLTDRKEYALNINNKTFFGHWSGALIKLGMECGFNKFNKICVFLKIESSTTKKAETPSTVAATASTFITSSSTSLDKSTLSTVEKSSQMSSMLLIVLVVVLLCLLVAAFFVVMFYRRRQKRLKPDKDDHLYEETASSNQMTGYEDPSQLMKMQKLPPRPYEILNMNISNPLISYEDPNQMQHPTPRPYETHGINISNPLAGYEDPAQMQHVNPKPYETPGVSISNPLPGYEDPAQMQHVSPRPYETPGVNISNPLSGYEDPAQMQHLTPNPYESPGVSIHVGNHQYEYPTKNPSPQNTLQNRTNNNFQYDYATREETSLLPLIQNGDVMLENDTPKSAKPRKKRNASAGQSSEKPVYHTLEEDTSETTDTTFGSVASSVKRDSLVGESGEKPLYHTLEEDTSGTTDETSSSATSCVKRDSLAGQSGEKTLYHTLEEDTSGTIDGTSSSATSCVKRDSLAGQSDEKTIYHTLEEDTSGTIDTTSESAASSVKRDSLAGQSDEKAINHTLEENTSDLSNPKNSIHTQNPGRNNRSIMV